MKFAILFVLLITSVSFAGTYSGGTGEPNDPYLIATPADMNELGETSADWSSCFKLVADVNMSAYTGTKYKIIGNAMTKFIGTFDGDGHVISNLTYTTTTLTAYVGVFGYANNATIENLDVENINFSVNGSYVGGLMGYQSGGSITNCQCQGSIVCSALSGAAYAGGLVGKPDSVTITNCSSAGSVSCSSSFSSAAYVYAGGLAGYPAGGGTITNCYSTCSATSSSNTSRAFAIAGGLVGTLTSGTISNCYSTGSISSITSSTVSSSSAGGLAGTLSSGIILNCYSTGSVSASSSTSSTSNSRSNSGGLVGYVPSGTISNCYSTGQASASGYTKYKGGLVGSYTSGTITACFWDTDTSGLSDGVGNVNPDPAGVIGKATADMKMQSTFTLAGWDFFGETTNGTADIWRMCVDGVNYSKLSWDFNAGDFVCPDGVDIYDLTVFIDQWLLEELSYDLYQDGQHIVNFFDFNIFANSWNGDNVQLAGFSSEWLQRDAGIANIAPDVEDDIVNFLDFAIFAENWLDN